LFAILGIELRISQYLSHAPWWFQIPFQSKARITFYFQNLGNTCVTREKKKREKELKQVEARLLR
jgi:hypothetical protein